MNLWLWYKNNQHPKGLVHIELYGDADKSRYIVKSKGPYQGDTDYSGKMEFDTEREAVLFFRSLVTHDLADVQRRAEH